MTAPKELDPDNTGPALRHGVTVTCAAAVLVGAAALLAACGGSGTPQGATPTTSTTAAVTTTTSTTLPWAPTAPQTTPEAAAARLVSAWSTGDHSLANTIASPSAVATLLAIAYPSGYLQARGCTQGANPGTCTYRNTRTNGIYEITVTFGTSGTSGSSGWYVSSVTPET